MPRRERLILALMLGAYFVLAVAFSLGPIFEGPDEIEHYRFVRTLVQTRALPDPYTQVRAQYHQAPLYYFLAAPFLMVIRDPDFPQIDGRLNPYYPFQIGFPGNDNKNLYLHSRTEDFPYTDSGTALAVHLMRLLSIALGACTVLAAYAIFRVLWPDRMDRRFAALAVVAFTPQFLYLSGTINNDNLLYLLATLTLLLLLRQRRDGPSLRGALLLGVVLGAALLTKVNAGFLVFPVGLAVLMDRRTWRYVPLILGVIALIAGWWYVRNTILYGDPTAVKVLLLTWKTETIRPGALALDVGIPRLPYAYETYWARFGQGAVPVAQVFYDFFDLLTVISVVGVAIWVIRALTSPPNLLSAGREGERKGVNKILGTNFHSSASTNAKIIGSDQDLKPSASPSPSLPAERGPGGEVNKRDFLIVLVFGLSWGAALVYYASTAWSGDQGRYLLPGIAAWGALIALALDVFTPRRIRWPAALSGGVLLATIATVSVFGYFLPAYHPLSAPAQIDYPLSYHYGGTAELIGISPATAKAHPGDTIYVTLYWRAIHPADSSLQSYLHSAGADVVKRDSLPATGNLLSTEWQGTWAERYIVPIPADADPQHVYPLLAGLYDPATKTNPPVTDDSGKLADPVVGRIAIAGPQASFAPAYKFGTEIGLADPQIQRDGDTLKVCLRWLSLAPVDKDYNVFIHVLAADGSPVAQADFQPKSGQYPTGAWTPGEALDDCTPLAIPGAPSSLRVGIGMYDLATLQRLAVTDAQGHAVPDNTVTVDSGK